jgi:hypothetical protein
MATKVSQICCYGSSVVLGFDQLTSMERYAAVWDCRPAMSAWFARISAASAVLKEKSFSALWDLLQNLDLFKMVQGLYQ